MIFICGIISIIIQKNRYVQIKFVWFISAQIASIFAQKRYCFIFIYLFFRPPPACAPMGGSPVTVFIIKTNFIRTARLQLVKE